MSRSNRKRTAKSDFIGAAGLPLGRILVLVLVTVSCLIAASPAWCQAQSSSAALAAARKKYVGAHVKIKGPLESASPGLLATYINWRIAKKGPQGRYFAVTPIVEARLPYGYERHPGSIVAVQLSNDHSEDGEPGPKLNFVVKFDDGVVAVCACALTNVDGNFTVVPSAKPATR